MSEDELKKLIDEYGNIAHHKELIKLEKANLINSVIPVNVQMEIDGINDEYAVKEKRLDDLEKKTRKELDKALDEYGDTLLIKNESVKVKSELLTVTYYPPVIEYDAKILDGYAISHPELIHARKENKPKRRIDKNK